MTNLEMIQKIYEDFKKAREQAQSQLDSLEQQIKFSDIIFKLIEDEQNKLQKEEGTF